MSQRISDQSELHKLLLRQPLASMGTRKEICQDDCGHGIHNHPCPVNDCRIMPSFDFNRRIFLCFEVDRKLRLKDGRRRFDDRPEDDRHSVGNAAVDAAVMVGYGSNLTVEHCKTVIRPLTGQFRKFKSGTESLP